MYRNHTSPPWEVPAREGAPLGRRLKITIMNLIDKLKAMEELFEEKVVHAAGVAVPITLKIDKILSSGTGLWIESIIPKGAPYNDAVIAAFKALEPALIILSDKHSALYTTDGVKGLLQRLGSEITAIVHGGKKPFGFYVKAFELVFDTLNP